MTQSVNSIIYDDKYKYLKSIQRSGFNEICLCFHLLKKEIYVLKVGLPQYSVLNIASIEKQTLNHKKIESKNVIQLIESKINGNKIQIKNSHSKNKNSFSSVCDYLVYEYADKGELFNYVKFNKGLYYKVARFYFRTLIKTLEDIHIKNICNIDIKL